MMLALTVTHHTSPWYVTILILALVIVTQAWRRWGRGGGRGPFGGGPSGTRNGPDR
jgi:hypothetical protein